jgi:molecular chaperone DnaK (HSP70)
MGVQPPPIGEGVLLIDDVGLELSGTGFAPVLVRGCELPCKGSFVAPTTSDNQKRFRIRLLRRSYADGVAISRISDFQIIGVPPGPAGERIIEVTLRAKKDSLTISAVEKETGTALTIRTVLMMGE